MKYQTFQERASGAGAPVSPTHISGSSRSRKSTSHPSFLKPRIHWRKTQVWPPRPGFCASDPAITMDFFIRHAPATSSTYARNASSSLDGHGHTAALVVAPTVGRHDAQAERMVSLGQALGRNVRGKAALPIPRPLE